MVVQEMYRLRGKLPRVDHQRYLQSKELNDSMFRMTLPLEHLLPCSSSFARFDPRWKFGAIVSAVVAVSLLSSLAMLAIAFAASLLLVVVARVPGRWFRSRISVLGLALLPFVVLLPLTIDRGGLGLQWSYFRLSVDGLWVAVELALKTLTILILVLILIGTTPFHLLLLAGRRLRIPGVFIQLTLLSYRYIFLLWEELHRLRIALRVAGFATAPTGIVTEPSARSPAR